MALDNSIMVGDVALLREYGNRVDATDVVGDIAFARLHMKGYYSKSGSWFYQTELAKLALGKTLQESRRAYGPGSDHQR